MVHQRGYPPRQDTRRGGERRGAPLQAERPDRRGHRLWPVRPRGVLDYRPEVQQHTVAGDLREALRAVRGLPAARAHRQHPALQLHQADAGAEVVHPRGALGPGRHVLRADGQRQDRGLPRAHPGEHDQERQGDRGPAGALPGALQAGHAGALPDAGALPADLRRGPEVLPRHEAPLRARLRPGAREGADRGAGQGRGPLRLHARPALGLRLQRHRGGHGGELLRAGRGRPHALHEHGAIRPRYRGEVRHAGQGGPADAHVLGHLPGHLPEDGSGLPLRARLHRRRRRGRRGVHGDPGAAAGRARPEVRAPRGLPPRVAGEAAAGRAAPGLHELQAPGQGSRREALRAEHRHGRPSWRPGPDRARGQPAEVPGRGHRRHGRDGRGLPRPGHQLREPRRELRPAQGGGGLRAAHRPHRPHRAPGPRHDLHRRGPRRRLARRAGGLAGPAGHHAGRRLRLQERDPQLVLRPHRRAAEGHLGVRGQVVLLAGRRQDGRARRRRGLHVVLRAAQQWPVGAARAAGGARLPLLPLRNRHVPAPALAGALRTGTCKQRGALPDSSGGR
mmetsp:Transcript_94808/g.306086  ORF Transcript_94808/g.306086 Transcript_94808/m.306086 type:complete len:562 (+) Transcript_94808:384-2069(+)